MSLPHGAMDWPVNVPFPGHTHLDFTFCLVRMVKISSFLRNEYVYLCLDWLQSLKQFFINVSYHILVASLTLMALLKQSHQS